MSAINDTENFSLHAYNHGGINRPMGDDFLDWDGGDAVIVEQQRNPISDREQLIRDCDNILTAKFGGYFRYSAEIRDLISKIRSELCSRS